MNKVNSEKQSSVNGKSEFWKYRFLSISCLIGVAICLTLLLIKVTPLAAPKYIGPTVIDARLEQILKGFFIVLVGFLSFAGIGAADLTKDTAVKDELRLTGVAAEMYVFAWSLVGIAFGGLVLQPLSCAIGADEVATRELKEFGHYCVQVGGYGAIFLKTVYFANVGIEKLRKRP